MEFLQFIIPLSTIVFHHLVTFLFNMVAMYSAEVLPSVPRHKSVVMFLTEKICVLHKLHSGMSYGAIGCEFILISIYLFI